MCSSIVLRARGWPSSFRRLRACALPVVDGRPLWRPTLISALLSTPTYCGRPAKALRAQSHSLESADRRESLFSAVEHVVTRELYLQSSSASESRVISASRAATRGRPFLHWSVTTAAMLAQFGRGQLAIARYGSMKCGCACRRSPASARAVGWAGLLSRVQPTARRRRAQWAVSPSTLRSVVLQESQVLFPFVGRNLASSSRSLIMRGEGTCAWR